MGLAVLLDAAKADNCQQDEHSKEKWGVTSGDSCGNGLRAKLDDYYESYVDIPVYRMAAARRVVEYLKNYVLEYLRSNFNLKVFSLFLH